MKRQQPKKTGKPCVILICACIILVANGLPTKKTIRQSATDLPPAPLARGSCRMVISEINTYPKWEKRQFIELTKVCEPSPGKSYKHIRFSMKTFKLVVIKPHGELVAVCTSDQMTEFKSDKTDPKLKHLIFTIGHIGVPNVNHFLESCEIEEELTEANVPGKFLPAGTDYPAAIALLYNEDPAVLQDIRLRKEGDKFFRTTINEAAATKIMQNLQDFYLYGSSTPFTRCEFYKRFYAPYYDRLDAILRDWHGRNVSPDRSLSRCASTNPEKSKENWLPMKPELFFSAPRSPGEPNDCQDAADRFPIETTQRLRKKPKLSPNSGKGFECYVLTDDESIDRRGTITSFENYQQGLTAAIKAKDICHVAAMEPFTDTSSAMDVDLAVEDENTRMPESGSTTVETPIIRTEEFTTEETTEPTLSNAVPTVGARGESTAFEALLEKDAPFIWGNCDSITTNSTVKRVTTGETPWLYLEDVLNPLVCFWLEVLETVRRVRCRLCHMLWKEGIIVDRPGSPFITKMVTEGQGSNDKALKVRSRNMHNIRSHRETNRLHDISVEYFRLFDQGLRGKELTSAFERKDGLLRKFLQSTENLIAAVFQSTRMGITFHNFNILTETLSYFDVDIGILYRNPFGMKTVLMSISETMHEQLVTYLNTFQPKFSLMCDTSSDIASAPSLALLIQTFDDKNNVNIFLYKVVELTEGEAGDKLYERFLNCIKQDRLEEYVRTKCVGFASDGGSNVRKFRDRLNQYTDHEIIGVHCMNHRWELIMEHSFEKEEYLELIDSTLNSLYRMFNSRSPKKKQMLQLSILELADRSFELKRIKKIRWIAHKLRATKIVNEHWKTIVDALRKVQQDKTVKLETRQTAKALEMSLIDPTFLATLAFVGDVAATLSKVSLNLQTSGSTLIGKTDLREAIITELRTLSQSDGPFLTKLLTNSSVPGQIGTPTLHDFENTSGFYLGIRLGTPDTLLVEQKLWKNRERYITKLIEQVDAYFPNDATDNFDIFNARKWPNSTITLAHFGTRDLLDANTRLKWNFDENVLRNDWASLKNAVFSTAEYAQKKNDRPEDFWSYYLQSKTISWPDSLRTIISNILTVPASSAQVERIYSLYTATKTHQRYSLKVSTVEAILRLKFNGVKSLAELPTVDLARGFLKRHARPDDTSRAVTRSPKEDSEVIKEFDDTEEISSDETTAVSPT